MRLLSVSHFTFLTACTALGCGSSANGLGQMQLYDAGGPDGSSAPDAQGGDTGVDGRAADAGMSAQDARAVDAGSRADASIDGGTDASTDAGADMSAPDASADTGAPDAAVESGNDGAAEGGGDGGASSVLAGRTYEFSTVPPAGPAELNPYGVAVVPEGFPSAGTLQPGDILFSNFNDPTNAPGLGATVVRITSGGTRSNFFTSAEPGLSAALGVLKSGFVIVGNVPSAGGDGGGSAIGVGALQVLDGNGNLVQTIRDAALLEDPWDLTIHDQGGTAQVFVSNVVSGAVTRLDLVAAGAALTVTGKTQIASGYATRPDPNAFVVGPGGLAYDAASDTLFVASAAEKVGGVETGSIFAVAMAGVRTTDAGRGTAIFADTARLHGPVGLAIVPNGDLVVANSDSVNADPNQPSEIVELSTSGQFVRQWSVDPSNGGAFGLTVGTAGGQAVLGAVDDNQSTLTVWETGQPYRPVLALSTMPPAGPADVNPYGISIVPTGFPTAGMLQPGDLLFSNFNDPANTPGAGTTVVRVTPHGARSTFFTSARPGLSAALGVLKSGLVVLGNVPGTGGGAVGQGALQVLDGDGALVQTVTDSVLLRDPWDLAIRDDGSTAQIFVSNVVSGAVTRLDVSVSGTTLVVNDKVQIASGYATRLDAAAFVVGPGGMAYDPHSDVLFVASAAETVGGAEVGGIFAVPNAGTRTTDAGKGQAIFADPARLHGPMGLAMTPGGTLIVANSDAVNADPNQPSALVELTATGQFVGQTSLDPSNGGAFGLGLGVFNGQPVLATPNDNQSVLAIRGIP